MKAILPASNTAQPLLDSVQLLPQSHAHISSSLNMSEPTQRPRSNTSASAKGRPRPKSRGSTASLQSADHAPHYHPEQPEQQEVEYDYPFMQTHHQRPIYRHSSEESVGRFPFLNFGMRREMPIPPPDQIQDHDMQQHPMHSPMYPSGAPDMTDPQAILGFMLNRPVDLDAAKQAPAPEDSDLAEGAYRRKKGSATSLANDAELRRLLEQYQGRKLGQVASEVQQHEGGGGKSEKAKQVFAMLWLQENCQRSTSSVRRDRVFQRYTERCGDERVPTLNPASFGKLVRIIFPNVQTRRLGVRGESKYHYVDLSLVLLDGSAAPSQRPTPTLPTFDGQHFRTSSTVEPQLPPKRHERKESVPHLDTAPPDTAEFPAPSASFGPQPTEAEVMAKYSPIPPALTKIKSKMHCEKSNTPLLRISTAKMSPSLVASLPSIRAALPASLGTYVGLPSPSSHSSPPIDQVEARIDLPDIHSYLTNLQYDRPLADSLSSLYRSYCIMVIDSFRYCRERPFFHHHTAYNGTMTVPVAKLFAEPQLAPWIQECDMRMYKKMIRYIAPLSTQVVPDAVWSMFNRVSTRLVPHLIASFVEKCPNHVVAAKIVPATRFSNLLKKLHRVNQAANNLAPLLSDDRNRSQMWLDMVSLLDPARLLDEAMPSPECCSKVEQNLRNEMKSMLAPLDDEALKPFEADQSTEWAQHFADRPSTTASDPISTSNTNGSFDRWIQWLERLPEMFEGHHAQCITDFQLRFWDSILTQLGLGGAPSYQVWWFLKTFLCNMWSWMTHMEGLLLPEEEQRRLDGIEREKAMQDEGWNATTPSSPRYSLAPVSKRKRTDDDVGGDERSTLSRSVSLAGRNMSRTSRLTSQNTSMAPESLKGGNEGDDEAENTGISHDDDEDEMNQPPLELPSIETSSGNLPQNTTHDDSGICLDIETENGTTKVTGATKRARGLDNGKQKQRSMSDWMLISDPVESLEGVVV